MSTSHKGKLAIVVATVVVSGMILLSESSIAETKPQVSVNTEGALEKGLMKSDTGTVIQQNVSKKNKIIDLPKKDVMLAPPPGPFLNEELSASPQRKKSPIAPKAPVQAAHKIQIPASPVNSLSLKATPVQPNNNVGSKAKLKPPVAPLSSPSKPSFGNVKQHDAPKLTQKIHAAPSGGQAPDLSKSKPPSPQFNGQPAMISPNAPIWSQKGQGTNFGSNHPKVAPNINGPEMNNNNVGLGYPVQQYMYVPVPMMPSNIIAPQMPIFNRVPAPMPNYWVPTPAANKPSMQKNVPKKDNN